MLLYVLHLFVNLTIVKRQADCYIGIKKIRYEDVLGFKEGALLPQCVCSNKFKIKMLHT
jgi:hypothetical protein